MKDTKLFVLTSLLVLATVVSTGVTRWADRERPAIAFPGEASVSDSVLPVQELIAEGICVSSTFYGFPRVEVGDGIEIPKYPPAKRLTYDGGEPQYIAKANAGEIMGFYDSVMAAGCWKVGDQRANYVLYTKEDKAVRLSLHPNPLSEKTVIAYASGTGAVLGETTVYAAQTPTCTGDQVLCTMNGGSWCQTPPCPTSTPPPATTCSGAYQQSGNSYPSCNYSTCPSGCMWGSDGCPSGCNTTSTTPPPPSSGTTCSGEYQQSGATYASCNYTKCPSGCNWTNGCPSGCYTQSTCSGEYQQAGSTSPSCNYSKCPSGCNWGSDGCPNGCMSSSASGSCSGGQQWCASSNSCVASGTPCGSSGSSCPSGQYWCSYSNSCKPTSDTNCPPSGGSSSGSYPDRTSCESAGGKWCMPTVSPHCHGPNDSAPCESDTPGGTSACPSGQYWCNGACVSNTTSCSSSYVSCPSGQYMCNGACVANTASCSSSPWPMNETDCKSQAKYWCTSSSAGGSSAYSYNSGWCQSMPCSGTSSSCGSGTYYCSSTNSCVPSGSSCGSPSTNTSNTSCSSGQYWCSYSNGCVSNSTSCMPSPNPTLQPTAKCGQCQVVQGSSCVPAPVGTLDPLCNGGQCDMYGGCVSLSGGRKLVGQGAICGDNWCNTEKGENKENCPNDGCTNAPPVQPQQVPSSPYQQNQQPQYPGPQYPQGQNEGSYPGGPGYQGPSEEEMAQMQEQQCQMMKQGMNQFVREMQRMQKMLDRIKKTLTQAGIGMPPELMNALAKAPELIEKIKASKTCDEIEGITNDMQDIAMTMQDLGPRMGELEGLGRMLKEADRQVKNMYRDFKRVQSAARRNPALADEVKELEVTVGLMSKAVADAKVLAKTDPFGARDLLEEKFWDFTEEFYERMRLIDMLSNVGRALSQANTELQRADRRVNTLARRKDVPKEVIVDLRAMLAEIKTMVPQLKELLTKKPVDFDELGMAAEDFWDRISEFEAEMEQWGVSTYVPQFQDGQGIKLDIPEGFIMMPQTSGGGFGGGDLGAPSSGFGQGGGGGSPGPNRGGATP